MLFPGPGGLAHDHSCLGYVLFGLLQHVLNKAALEDYLEVTTGPECNGTQCWTFLGSSILHPCYVSSTYSHFIFFPSAISGAGYCFVFKALYVMEPGYLQIPLSLETLWVSFS